MDDVLVDRIIDELLAASDQRYPVRERFFDRVRTVAVIKAVLWAHQVERRSHASAYAYYYIMEALRFEQEPEASER